MKTKSMNSLAKQILMGFFVTTLLLTFTECSRKTTFLSSSVVPAAEGTVKVTRDGNNNYVIQVSFSHLAEASMLTPPKQTYIVWMVSDRGDTQNIGQMKSSDNLNAFFEAVSSSKPIKILITAENDPGTQYPGEPVVLVAEKF